MKKRVCFVLFLSLIMAMTMAAMAYAQPRQISSGYDLVKAIENGEEGVLTQDINADTDSLRVREGNTAVIDMKGYSIELTCRKDMELKGNIALYNGHRVRIYMGNGPKCDGVIALNDIEDVAMRAHEFACTNLLMVNVKEQRLEQMIYDPVVVTDSKNAMSKEQLVDMVNTGKLPQLECEGYLFTEWKDQSGNAITEWKAEGITEIKAYWDKDIQVTFDTDGGTCDVESVRPLDSGKLKSIPAAKKDGVCFDGWITEAGDKVTKDTVFKESTTVKATWVEESERTDAMTEFMDEQGFSQSSIDKHMEMLKNGSAASTFGSGNIWMIIACIFIVLSAVLGIAAIKRK